MCSVRLWSVSWCHIPLMVLWMWSNCGVSLQCETWYIQLVVCMFSYSGHKHSQEGFSQPAVDQRSTDPLPSALGAEDTATSRGPLWPHMLCHIEQLCHSFYLIIIQYHQSLNSVCFLCKGCGQLLDHLGECTCWQSDRSAGRPLCLWSHVAGWIRSLEVYPLRPS